MNTFLERLGFVAAAVLGFWRYPLTEVEGQPLRVGTVLLALLLVGLGLLVSRLSSRRIRELLERRLRIDPGVASSIANLAFYLLVVAFALVALRTVNFPLTAFTVAGGALAIGIGFGSQNVMNNFISGLILMFERPVRTHDLIEINGTHGTIELIGARSTRIRTTDGRQVIVPNSFFLESNVVNWTLSDDLIRAQVKVGVRYGSPTREVESLIRKALDQNPHVLKLPEPIIIFAGFGDNALEFEAHFWLRARSPLVVEQAASEVRFCIDDLFREHQLEIAFPQRDVHVDAAAPIEVRVLGAKA